MEQHACAKSSRFLATSVLFGSCSSLGCSTKNFLGKCHKIITRSLDVSNLVRCLSLGIRDWERKTLRVLVWLVRRPLGMRNQHVAQPPLSLPPPRAECNLNRQDCRRRSNAGSKVNRISSIRPVMQMLVPWILPP